MKTTKERKTKVKRKPLTIKEKTTINVKEKLEFDENKDEVIRGHDIIMDCMSLSVPTEKLLVNTDFKIIFGRKYGIIGRNGTGKTTLLKFLYGLKHKFPDITMSLIEQEAILTNEDKTVFEEVIEANIERSKLMKIYETTDDMDLLNEVCEKLTEMRAFGDDALVRKILYGLGFTNEMQNSKVREFSGGFRMRISLAIALYLKPKLLLLDEPNNHLDINSVIWLTDYLKKDWKSSLVIISHDKNFINEICTDIIHLENYKLNYYKGNYNSFASAHNIVLKVRNKKWKEVMKTAKNMNKTNATRQEIQKFLEQYNDIKPPKPYIINLNFNVPYELNSETYLDLENVSIGYGDKTIVNNINLALGKNSKYLLVGKNGAGKTTLFKTIMGLIPQLSGTIDRNSRLRIGYYNQHATDILPMDKTPCEYLSLLNPVMAEQTIRKYLGTIGLRGSLHTNKISTLSGGQKSRVLFVSVFIMNPHILLLDEPTNHLDMETIEGLIDSINEYDGTVIVSTHNIHLITSTKLKILEICNGNLINTNFDTYYDKVLSEIEAFE